GHPFLHRVTVRHHVGHGLVEVVHLRLGEETHPPEVDAQQRYADGPGELGGAQQGAVSAERDHDLRALGRGRSRRGGRHARQVEVGHLVGHHPHREAGRDQVPRHRPGVLGAGPPAGVGHQQRAAGHVDTPAPLAAARTRSGSTGGASRRSHRKISMLPAGPGSGLATTPATPRPSASAAAATPSTASARWAGSRTTPPAPTRPRPTSNCGLTSSSRSPSGAVQAARAGSTSRREMNDRSATVRSTWPPMRSGVRSRTLVRSRTRTRGSVRNDQASCPYPTSTATTSAAPARSRTSVKPPVDAPASRQRRPATAGPVGPRRSRAPASLSPPRDTYSGRGEVTVTGSAGSTWVAALVAGTPRTLTRPAAT